MSRHLHRPAANHRATRTPSTLVAVAGPVALLAMVAASLAAGCASTAAPPSARPTRPPTDEPGILASGATAEVPAIAARAARVAVAMASGGPMLRDGLDGDAAKAQTLAVADKRLADAIHTVDGRLMRAEVFNVLPLRPGDVTDATGSCGSAPNACYRVELYLYPTNSAVFAVVNVTAAKVLSVNTLQDVQPDLPPELADLATQIAVGAPEVAAALGFQPAADQAKMAMIKTALNQTKCERSHHLCVAPTFIQGERALWAIVDLTDNALVGVRWTSLGASDRRAITKQMIQDAVVTADYCERSTQLNRDGWQLDYILTSTDGLRVSNVTFNGRAMLASAKLVDWHISYSHQEGFGYSDAVGCPEFSAAAVPAWRGPDIVTATLSAGGAGFALVQDFRSDLWPAPCNYRYEQRYEFYQDGRFRIVAGNLGRGCGDDGTYRPVLRVALPEGIDHFAAWDGQAWKPWFTESWAAAKELSATGEGYQFRLSGTSGGDLYVEPGSGQFGDGGRGDDALIYVTRHRSEADEGDSDLMTLGSCCNSDFRQGPEKFIDPTPEPIDGEQLVLWYVAQMKNDGTPGHKYCWADSTLEDGMVKVTPYPCYAGPMFVPTTANP